MSEVERMNLSGFSTYNILQTLFSVARNRELPFVFYRLPRTDKIEAIIGLAPVYNYEIKYSSTDSGFVFSPYSNFDNSKSIFIPNAIRYSSTEDDLKTDSNLDVKEIISDINKQLNKKDRIEIAGAGRKGTKRVLQNTPDYVSLVRKGIEEIKKGAFEKVVLASQKQVELGEEFDVIQTFLKLSEKYINGFISYVSIPNIGDWLGATPELLVHIDQKIMRTVALAGTKTIGTDIETTDDIWNQKEYREQQLVAGYVEDAIKKSGFKKYKSYGPNTAKAGELAHLKTEFETQLCEGDEHKISELLKELHPTPAICGLPKAPAQEFISNNERFDREFYAGYLGPINQEDTMNLFVNLRCMQIMGASAMLYAGAGIISNSDPENELSEIFSKFRIMESVLDIPLHDKKVQNL